MLFLTTGNVKSSDLKKFWKSYSIKILPHTLSNHISAFSPDMYNCKSSFCVGLKRTMSVPSPSSREATKAVATLLAHSRTAWPILNWPSGIQPNMTAAMAARNPTTVAWTCDINNRVHIRASSNSQRGKLNLYFRSSHGHITSPKSNVLLELHPWEKKNIWLCTRRVCNKTINCKQKVHF